MIEYKFTVTKTGQGRCVAMQLEGADIYERLAGIQATDKDAQYELLHVDEIVVHGLTTWKRKPSVTVAYVNEHGLSWIQTSGDHAGDICLAVKGDHQTDIHAAQPEYKRLVIRPLRPEGLGERTQEQLAVLMQDVSMNGVIDRTVHSPEGAIQSEPGATP